MSLYNMLFKVDVNAGNFLVALGIDYKSVDRLRDVTLVKIGEEYRIRILTRTGGGNRDSHKESNDRLTKHDLYISDADVASDPTYAEFDFKAPEQMLGEIEIQGAKLENLVDNLGFAGKFDMALKELGATQEDVKLAEEATGESEK